MEWTVDRQIIQGNELKESQFKLHADGQSRAG